MIIPLLEARLRWYLCERIQDSGRVLLRQVPDPVAEVHLARGARPHIFRHDVPEIFSVLAYVIFCP